MEQLRKLAGLQATAFDERTRDQVYEVANAILDSLENSRRLSMSSAPSGPRGPLLRLVPAARREELEERAAIREFDGGQSRVEAERAALRDAALDTEE